MLSDWQNYVFHSKRANQGCLWTHVCERVCYKASKCFLYHYSRHYLWQNTTATVVFQLLFRNFFSCLPKHRLLLTDTHWVGHNRMALNRQYCVVQHMPLENQPQKRTEPKAKVQRICLSKLSPVSVIMVKFLIILLNTKMQTNCMCHNLNHYLDSVSCTLQPTRVIFFFQNCI